MKRGGSENQDRGIDEEGEGEGEGGIENGEAECFAFVGGGGAKSAGLHDAGMKIEIVRHHGCAKDANGNVKHLAVAQDFRAREKTADRLVPERLSEEDLVGEADRNGGDERDDKRFDQAEAAALQRQNDQHIERSDQDSGEQGQPEEQFQGDGRAENFSKIAGGDGDFAENPQHERGAARVRLAAGLRQVASHGDAELGRKRLEQHGHEAAEQDHTQERVAELRAATQIRGPVPRVHVADSDQITGTGKCERLSQPGASRGYWDGPIGLGERRLDSRASAGQSCCGEGVLGRADEVRSRFKLWR